MDGLHHMREAALAVGGPGGFLPRRAAVAEAFGHVWAALDAADRWPDELRAQAAGLIVAMRRHGSRQETAAVLTHAEVRDFAGMVRRFVEHADRLELLRTVANLRARGGTPASVLEPRADQARASAGPSDPANS